MLHWKHILFFSRHTPIFQLFLEKLDPQKGLTPPKNSKASGVTHSQVTIVLVECQSGAIFFSRKKDTLKLLKDFVLYDGTYILKQTKSILFEHFLCFMCNGAFVLCVAMWISCSVASAKVIFNNNTEPNFYNLKKNHE